MNLTPEQIDMITQLGEIIRHQTFAQEMMNDFRKQYPYAMPPNLLTMIESNLKDNIQVLYREMNVIHKPQSEKRRWVCSSCKSVFATPLPGGLCDECRVAAAAAASQPDYSQFNAVLRRTTRVAETPEATPTTPKPEAVKPAKNEDASTVSTSVAKKRKSSGGSKKKKK
ncbi:hypothetical protein GX645_07350 [Candidatus Sumerlaeota bacterium]|nr:hypothetical protein [Candidatus Sumerlaeales bacterium]NLD62252.1 hypothetical protein [Candidatus Sumerlaeota bacterium]